MSLECDTGRLQDGGVLVRAGPRGGLSDVALDAHGKLRLIRIMFCGCRCLSKQARPTQLPQTLRCASRRSAPLPAHFCSLLGMTLYLMLSA